MKLSNESSATHGYTARKQEGQHITCDGINLTFSRVEVENRLVNKLKTFEVTLWNVATINHNDEIEVLFVWRHTHNEKIRYKQRKDNKERITWLVFPLELGWFTSSEHPPQNCGHEFGVVKFRKRVLE